MTEIPELESSKAALLALREDQVRDAARWEAAIDAFLAAVEACEDPEVLERVLLDDVEDDLPIAAKSRAFERRLELGPRTLPVLRAYSLHLWLHGPERDDEVEALEAEIAALESSSD